MRLIKILLLVIAIAALAGLGLLYYQGQQKPRVNSPYVALGSSFAAGLALGPRMPGSPLVCQRSANGYPQQLARLTGLALTDTSCSAATVRHVLRGGQVFLGPQIDALGKDTRLVTITAGGNDVDYVGDLTMMAYQRKGGFAGFIAGLVWQGAKPAAKRPFAGLQADLAATVRAVRSRAPKAQIVVVTYPEILPGAGTCPQLGIDARQATLMRAVALRLTEVTRAAVGATGATLIDMATLAQGHDACSAQPWVNGATPAHGAPFHPTLAGARAVAQQILLAKRTDP